jgi:hypothetical protein
MAEVKEKKDEGTEQKVKAKATIPTNEQKAKAKEILGKSKGKIFVNEDGEFFTSENLAALSVENKKDKYALAFENK